MVYKVRAPEQIFTEKLLMENLQSKSLAMLISVWASIFLVGKTRRTLISIAVDCFQSGSETRLLPLPHLGRPSRSLVPDSVPHRTVVVLQSSSATTRWFRLPTYFQIHSFLDTVLASKLKAFTSISQIYRLPSGVTSCNRVTLWKEKYIRSV